MIRRLSDFAPKSTVEIGRIFIYNYSIKNNLCLLNEVNSMNFYDFYMGNEFEAYRYLGAHIESGVATFRVFAPAAEKVSVIGDFNDWQETPMERVYDGQFFELRCHATEETRYKFRIYGKDGRVLDRVDPYAFCSAPRPDTASVLYDGKYRFHDNTWLKKRTNREHEPLNIYELHFGSWKKTENGDSYSYRELAPLLIPYLKEHGYNYLETMPLCEYPSDQSWGYQATGYFSPTSRYGTPDGLKYFIDECHKNGIGVLLDFVPVHFAVDDYGLWNFDGTALYEYPNSAVGYNEWGSCNFMHSRGEVRSFLQSSAHYWLNEFHFDGLRIDAVRNLIYWQGDESRGINQSAINFLRGFTAGLHERLNGIMLIAEDSSSYSGITVPVSEGGLGFDYKWDMGFMNDTLNFLSMHPYDRKAAYHKITFSMHYFYNEKFLLPFSHDEVVHGKKTIVDKMYGSYEEKFSQARALYLYMLTHTGKKLNFMGNELGMLREWDEKRELDWDILRYPAHDSFAKFITKLNELYRKHSALWERDYDRNGFAWINCHLEGQSLYVYKRMSETEQLLVILNFSDKEQSFEYLHSEPLLPLINSDWEEYGGKTLKDESPMKMQEIKIAPYSAICFKEQ